MSRSISSEKVNTSIVNPNKYIYQGNKSLGKQIKFAPILEEQINNMSPIHDTNNISNAYNNNNSSFENSNIDYNTMSKFRPSLNLSCLPPIFEIPKQRLDKNVLNTLELDNNKSISNPKNNSIYNEANNPNIKMMRGSKFNLKNTQSYVSENGFNSTAQDNDNKNSIRLNKNQNYLPPINSHTYYNNNQLNNNNMGININNIDMNKNRQKVLLKPIQIKNLQYKNGGGSSNNIYNQQINNNNIFVKNATTMDIAHNNFNMDKIDEKTMKYLYDLTSKNIIRSEKLKEERALRAKEMSNISIGQNKNYIDKNIVILSNKDNKDFQKNIINNIPNSDIFRANKDEFISINRTKTKVLHIPTLQIFDRYDISIKNYSLYDNYIKNWLKIMRGALQIKYIIENDKINCYSVIIERSKNCSLGNLLRSVGSINEYILKNITKQILPLIKICGNIFDYRAHDINEQLYNYTDVDNIWINEKYNVLLYPGKLNARFNKIKNNNIENFLKMNFGLNKDNNILIKDSDDQKNDNMQLNIDLMNFGITLININIFILNITVNDLFELTPINNSNYNNNCCCLFHFFYNNNTLFKSLYETLLKSNQYTEEYINFLHSLTNLDTSEKNLYETIINHSFMTNNNSNINDGPNINELIKIGKIYNFSNGYFTSNSNIENFDLIKQKISGRIGILKVYYETYGIKDIKTLISINNIELDELCRELRINFEELQDKLLVIYESIFDGK